VKHEKKLEKTKLVVHAINTKERWVFSKYVHLAVKIVSFSIHKFHELSKRNILSLFLFNQSI